MFRGVLIRKGRSDRQPVSFSLAEGYLYLSTGKVISLSEVEVGIRAGKYAPFFLYLPDGSQLIVTEGVQELEVALNEQLPVHRRFWVHKFETWQRSVLIALAFLILGLVFWFTKGSDWAAAMVVEMIPPELESYLGEQILFGLKRMGISLRAPETEEQPLEDMFHRLARYAGFSDAHLYIMPDTSMLNAFAIPGGYVVFTEAMVDRYLEEDSDSVGVLALAGVVAHELGHIQLQHTLRLLVKSALVASIFTVLTGDVSIVALGMAKQVLVLSYRREYEEQADEYAIRLLLDYGVDPEPFLQLMAELAEEEPSEDVLPEFVRSHPYMSRRLAHMRQIIEAYRSSDRVDTARITY